MNSPFGNHDNTLLQLKYFILHAIKYCLILLIAYLMLSQPIGAQQYNFTRYSEKDGLRNNIIFSFLKDRYGYLWIGTQNGLNRFDGSHFTVFKKTNSNHSLPNNTVHTLCEDKAGNIWGGTDNGIFCYTQSTNQFTTYNKPPGAISNNVTNILCDAQGDIYTAGIADLMKLNKEKNSFEVLASVTPDLDSLSFFALGKNRLLKDEANNGLWIASANGIMFYDLRQRQLLNAKNSPGVTLFAERNTSAITRSANGNIWFYDQTTKSIRLFDPGSKHEIRSIALNHLRPDYRLSTILEDRKGKLWLSSWNNEFFILDTKKQDYLEKIDISKDYEGSLFFWAAFEDENGSIWLGTLNGISICTPDKYIYKSCRLSSRIPALKNNVILSLEENPADKSWWLLTANDLVIQYHPLTAQYHEYHFKVPDLKGISVISIATPQIGFIENRPVIVTQNGMWQLRPGALQFTRFTLLPREYADFHIQRFIDNGTSLYLTDGTKLLEWNKADKKARWINTKETRIPGKAGLTIQTLLWTPGHPIGWSYNKDFIGVVTQNTESELIKLSGDTTEDTRSYFHYADMDSRGNIWVNNKGVGLYRYQPVTQRIRHWTSFDGLADNHFHSLKADDKGNLWMLYFNKASVFNEASNSFINFSIPHAENFFNYYNWSIKRTDGVVMGTIANEVFEFIAGNIKLTPANNKPHLSVINVSGKEYLITGQSELSLNPDQQSLRFRFGFMADAGIFPHHFEYKLDGVDKSWIQSETSNEAVYNNLAPGRYVFHLVVKGQNSAWQSESIRFVVTIKTPFYKSGGFYFLLFLALFSSLYLFYRYRMNQKEKLMSLENKAQSLEKEKALVMYENLKQQLNPHFLFNSLTSLNSLIVTAPRAASAFLDSLSKTYRYILKSRDHETVPLIEEIRFAENYVKLQKTRFEKGFDVEMKIPEEHHHRRIVPVTLQNLIENAIKHNIIDEERPLLVTLFVEEDLLVVRNNLQKKKFVETSNRQGLANLQSLYSYLSPVPVQIEETSSTFTIKLPLL